jgi:hypothetical protein
MGAAPTTGGLPDSPCGSTPVFGEVQPITHTTIAPDTIADTTLLAVFIRPLKSRAYLDSSSGDYNINAPICVKAWPHYASGRTACWSASRRTIMPKRISGEVRSSATKREQTSSCLRCPSHSSVKGFPSSVFPKTNNPARLGKINLSKISFSQGSRPSRG